VWKPENLQICCHAQCFVRVGGVQKSIKIELERVSHPRRSKIRFGTAPGRSRDAWKISSARFLSILGSPAGPKGSQIWPRSRYRSALLGDKILNEFAECVKNRSGIVLGVSRDPPGWFFDTFLLNFLEKSIIENSSESLQKIASHTLGNSTSSKNPEPKPAKELGNPPACTNSWGAAVSR